MALDAQKMENRVRKLLVRLPNWVGDAMMALPALSVLRERFRETEITFLGKGAVLDLFRENRIADRFMEIKGPSRSFIAKWELVRKLKSERYEMAILLQNAFEAAFIAFLAAIPERIGYKRDGRGFLLSRAVNPPENRGMHQTDYYLNLLSGIEGIRPLSRAPALVISREEVRGADDRLRELGVDLGRPVVGVHAGAAYGSAKRWESERFSRLCDRIVREKNAQILLFGSKEEKPIVDEIKREMEEKAINLAGQTTLRELIALISSCRLFLSNDSGPMHIASALNVPLVAIFGPTDPRETAPAAGPFFLVRKKTVCSPCLLRECPIDHRCMTAISVDEVLERVHLGLVPAEGPPVPAVILDRDGTLNPDTGYISSVEDFRLFAESPEAVRIFNQAGLPVYIVTNQSGVARGYFSEERLREIHRKLETLLSEQQARLSGIYYCPHHPDAGCDCRKPGTGLLRRILKRQPLDFHRTYVVGDKLSDLLLAEKVNAKSVLVLTGKGEETRRTIEGRNGILPPDHIADNILLAARWIREDIQAEALQAARKGRS